MRARFIAANLVNVSSVACRQIKVEAGPVATIYTQEGQVGTATAAIQTETQARINGDNALSSSITTLSAQLNNATTGLPATYAGLVAEQSARAAGDSALSSQITALTTTVNANAAAISTESTTRATAVATLASQISTLAAQTAINPNLCPDVASWVLTAGMQVINDGTFGQLVVHVSPPSFTQAYSPAFSCTAEATYTVTGDSQMVLGSGGSGQVYFDLWFYDGAGNPLLDGPQSPISYSHILGMSGTRAAHAISIAAPPGAVTMRARFIASGLVNVSSVAFRMVKVEAGPAATIYTTEGQILAQAQQITTLQSTAGANTASIQTLQSTVNGLSAQWTVKTDVNGYIAGIGLFNTGATSSVIFRADTLAVVAPGSTAAASPFVVSGGQVVMNTAFIQNLTSANIAAGSISGNNIAANTLTAAHFNIAQLSAISANLGTVTAGVVQNAAGSAKFDLSAGQIVFNNGSVMKVQGLGFGTSNQFLEWFGPSMAINQCSEANAVSYLKTNGAAYFGGALSAGTLTTSRSTSDTSASAMVETPSFGSNGHTITVTLSFSYSSALHQTMTSTTQFNSVKSLISPAPTSTDYQNWYSSGANGGATIQLYRSVNGGGYALVATLSATGGWTWAGISDAGDSIWTAVTTDGMSGSLTYTDPQLIAQNRQYKAVMTGRSPYLTIGGNVTGSQMITLTCVEQ